MPRSKKRRRVPDLPPEQGFAWLAKQQRRATTKAANHAKSGYVDEDQRRLEERSAVAEAEVVAQFAAAQAIPLIERIPEYVIEWDEEGQAVGIRPL